MIGVTKMDLVEYYLTVADAALVGCRDRPTIMHRFPNGVDGEPFYQKRVPTQRPPWVQTATITFPSGRHAVMIAPADAAHLVWMANLACLDLNPWPVRVTMSTIPTSCASTWTRRPASRGATCET